MISTETRELLRQLKQGRLDSSQIARLERLGPDEFLPDAKNSHPVVFQERQIRQKHEIGMARTLSLETAARQVAGSSFLHYSLFPALKNCLLISYYGDALSEVTILSGIRVHPKGGPTLNVVLKMGHGYKLDRTPDGWSVKRLGNRAVSLPESFLLARGWKFEVFGMFLSNTAGSRKSQEP